MRIGGGKNDSTVMPSIDELESRDRIVLVGVPDSLTDRIRRRYREYEIAVRPSYLSGIAELADGHVAAVLIVVPPLERRAEKIVAGFRKALANGTRLILCCEPAAEPAVLSAGADDYLIYPPTDQELDAGLGLAGPPSPGLGSDANDAVYLDELRGVVTMCRDLTGSIGDLLGRAAEFLHGVLRNTGVQIEYRAHRGTAGQPVPEPVWVEEIGRSPERAGRILIGARPKFPFTHADVEKIRVYADLLASLLESADCRHDWQRLAMTDDVSGLHNRRYLLQALAQLLKRAEAERFRVTLLIFDIDDFKRFNDEFGHAVGDELIRETGRLFSQCCRRRDIVTRLGGDEFAVVFWDAEGPREVGSKHPSDVLGVLERFRRVLRAKDWQTLGPGAEGRLTISGGLASFPWDARTPDELLRSADSALKTAKKRGKDRIYLVGQKQDDRPPDLPT
jgi:diguanylate cyclase (GGDEF)-like protein